MKRKNVAFYNVSFEGIRTMFAGSSCNDLVTSDLIGSNVISGHFDKCIRFWDTRTDASPNKIELQGKITSLDLSPGKLQLSRNPVSFHPSSGVLTVTMINNIYFAHISQSD